MNIVSLHNLAFILKNLHGIVVGNIARTYNGKLKIKPKQEACHMYKECTDNYKDIIIKSLYPYNMNQENLQKLEKQIKEIKDMYESLAGNIQY